MTDEERLRRCLADEEYVGNMAPLLRAELIRIKQYTRKLELALGAISSAVDEAIQTATRPERQDYDPNDCHCQSCRPVTFADMRFPLCPLCGNKRCPHCADHRYRCTNSNLPDQVPELIEP